jgi:hypothetical protein
LASRDCATLLMAKEFGLSACQIPHSLSTLLQ